MLPLDLQAGRDLGRERGRDGPGLVAGQQPVVEEVPEIVAELLDRLQLVDQVGAVLRRAEAGQERSGGSGLGDPGVTGEPVEGGQGLGVQRREGKGTLRPLLRGAVPGEAGEEPQQLQVRLSGM